MIFIMPNKNYVNDLAPCVSTTEQRLWRRRRMLSARLDFSPLPWHFFYRQQEINGVNGCQPSSTKSWQKSGWESRLRNLIKGLCDNGTMKQFVVAWRQNIPPYFRRLRPLGCLKIVLRRLLRGQRCSKCPLERLLLFMLVYQPVVEGLRRGFEY